MTLPKPKQQPRLEIIDEYSPKLELLKKLKSFLENTNIELYKSDYGTFYLKDEEYDEIASIDFYVDYIIVKVDHSIKERMIKLFTNFTIIENINVKLIVR